MVYKTKKIENLVRQFFLFIIGGLIILEMIFALPPAMNLQGSDHLRKYFTWIFCKDSKEGSNE